MKNSLLNPFGIKIQHIKGNDNKTKVKKLILQLIDYFKVMVSVTPLFSTRNFSIFWICGANSLTNLPSQGLSKAAYRILSFYRKQIPTCITTKLSSALALLNIQEFIITKIRHTL